MLVMLVAMLLGGHPAWAQSAGGRPTLADPTQPNLLLEMQVQALPHAQAAGRYTGTT